MTTQDPKINSLADLRIAAVDAHQNNDTEKALNLYRLYLHNRPHDAIIWSNLGALFRKQKNYELAAVTQQRALELEPDTISLMNNAANAFYDAGYIHKSLKIRQRILNSDLNDKENYVGLGKCYRGLHRLDEAQEVLRAGIEKFPDYAELYIQLAFAELAAGDYTSGFKTFNWRWKGDEISLPDFSFPKWDGEPLNDKTILVTPEQGFGDTVLMARFLSDLKKLGPKVKMVVKKPLQRLFTNIQKDVEFIEKMSDLNDCDYWVPMMDLPLYLNATLDKLPKPADLFVPQDSVDRARQITAPFKDRFKVGVMWSGSVTYRANHKRSFDHRRFLELCDIPSLQMFSLYKGPLLDAYVEDGTSAIIVNAAGSDRDFADSAALMQELDLVISMDSAIVHIGASLGVEVWNLLHSEAYWLYQPFPDYTPWYASMRLIRQTKSGDWDGTFNSLNKDLTKRVDDWKNK